MREFTDWASAAPYFTEAEMRCKHTGECHMNADFMEWLIILRKRYARPMRINSAYRHPTHPAERNKKGTLGDHPQGCAVDVAVRGADALALLELAIGMGATRVGVSQKSGGPRFIHISRGSVGLPTPALWSY